MNALEIRQRVASDPGSVAIELMARVEKLEAEIQALKAQPQKRGRPPKAKLDE